MLETSLTSHRKTPKIALLLFFLELGPTHKNKDIFNIKHLCYTIIKVKEHRINNQIVQCLRCQGYGHTKSYCNQPPKCVHCDDLHLSTPCQKTSCQPARCALCDGDHLTNYRGCSKYKEIQPTRRKPPTQAQNSPTPLN